MLLAHEVLKVVAKAVHFLLAGEGASLGVQLGCEKRRVSIILDACMQALDHSPLVPVGFSKMNPCCCPCCLPNPVLLSHLHLAQVKK